MTVYACLNCGQLYPGVSSHVCPTCGGTFGIPGGIQFERKLNEPDQPGIWHYRHSFGLPDSAPSLSLGEGATPLIAAEIANRLVWLKLESANPTGSYKDRLAAVMVSLLAAYEVRAAVEDSSGNAGAAFAAYAARAGIQARVYVPSSAAGPKLAQIERFGVEVVPVPGPRQEAANAVLAEAAHGSVYASHAYLPHGLAGIATIAYELIEQLGQVPGTVVAPVGHGGLLLGIVLGFQALLAAGEIKSLPQFVGVQAAENAPLWAAAKGQNYRAGSTIAGGIAVSEPVRAPELLDLYRQGAVDLVTVPEDEIRAGQQALARQGIDAEPTSAVVVDACRQLFARGESHSGGPVAAVVSGHGLKG